MQQYCRCLTRSLRRNDDRKPNRIRHLIYLDAFIPEDGDSWRSLSGGAPHNWPVYVLTSDHNPQWSNVHDLAEMLDMISRQAE